jgi:hypothetical protein
MYTLVSASAVAFGIFVTVSPARAARVWGWKNIDQLSPAARAWYFRVYGAWGLILCLAGILLEAARV